VWLPLAPSFLDDGEPAELHLEAVRDGRCVDPGLHRRARGAKVDAGPRIRRHVDDALEVLVCNLHRAAPALDPTDAREWDDRA
jgi:hypothetical protein